MSSLLWILNSSLVGVLALSFLASNLFEVEPPRVNFAKMPEVSQPVESVEKKEPAKAEKSPFEKIYKNDIFGTFLVKQDKPAKQTLVSPIPDFTPPAALPAPAIPTYDFIPALEVTIKGIIMSDDENRCVVMIEDDSKKESLYHIGDKIKDAQIIKIAKNEVIFLRGANGQLETSFLRKGDALINKDPQTPWKYIVKSVDDSHYEIDPNNFKLEVDSLGNFLERVSVVGTAYQKGVPSGIKIGQLDKGDLGEILGLQQGDVIVSINNKSPGVPKERMDIYNMLTEAKLDYTATVTLKRAGADKVMYYKLAPLRKVQPSMFSGKQAVGESAKEAKGPEANFTPSRQQEREKLIREFKQQHHSKDQSEAISRIRQRLLDNLKTRVKDNRVR